MYPADRTLNRMIQRTLYSLKRQYGGTVSVYRPNDAETDVRTGRKTIDKDVFVVRRAVVLPVKVSREVIQSISQISANKAFVYGGNFDSGLRKFIIDARDLPKGFDSPTTTGSSTTAAATKSRPSGNSSSVLPGSSSVRN